jgi:hypothetical protein
MGVFDDFAKVALTGITAAGKALGAAQSAIENLVGIDGKPATKAPVNGPADLDQAVSDLANRAER